MECDRNMGLVKMKSYIEVPDDWISVIANAVRDSYNGTFMTYSMTRKSTKTQKKQRLLENQKDVIEMKHGLNHLPSNLYNKAI
ncbi:hypothetical protein J6590_009018 [Homalodisca vitripennis]|nr:hypothetical protein J6590_009018 [Homalodisca vitripennis]